VQRLRTRLAGSALRREERGVTKAAAVPRPPIETVVAGEGVTPAGVVGHRAGYEMSMTPEDDLKKEVGQSVTLVGMLVAVILIGLLVGLAI
jgi:hypothetical protein